MSTKIVVAVAMSIITGGCTIDDDFVNDDRTTLREAKPDKKLSKSVKLGQQIFRHETFNDEAFWTDKLHMHEVIANRIDPVTALGLGIKVDSEALEGINLADFDLEDPATTVALLGLGAIIGLEGHVDENGELVSVGVTCALCHTDVEDDPEIGIAGIGERLDGFPNRDLNVGAILAASPFFAGDDMQLAEFNSWGPGFYDPRWNFFAETVPVRIPPAYGLRGVELETYTGDGVISYWNSYVAVTQMGGQGVFVDERIGVEVVRTPDLVTPRLPALLAYQLSLEAPPPPQGSFDKTAASRGRKIFDDNCERCHAGSNYTDAGETLHDPAETGVDADYAERSATKQYRTTPLRALWQHPPYFHDGSQATLRDVVDHYDEVLALGLAEEQKRDLTEYLKSL